MLQKFYKLEGQTPVVVESFEEWSNWMASTNNTVMWNEFNDCTISTVFIGIDASPTRNSPPKLFETLVMGGVLSGKKNYYSTYKEAIAGHLEMCVLVFKSPTA